MDDPTLSKQLDSDDLLIYFPALLFVILCNRKTMYESARQNGVIQIIFHA